MFSKILGRELVFSLLIIVFFSIGSSIVGQTRDASLEVLEKQMEQLKASMESSGRSPVLEKQYSRLWAAMDKCSPFNQLVDGFTRPDQIAPTANLCVSGSLAVADTDFNRPLTNSTGTGIGNGTVGNCSLSGSGTAVNHDVISINVTGCAVFPTEVTATLCGPAGCQHVGNTDTVLALYRNVAAGDPLTANGGLPSVFNPASPCTNARAGSDDLGITSGTPNNPGGATCNQVVGASCVGPCTSPSNAGGLSGFKRQLGNGRFTLVIAGFGNATIGGYTLYVDAPAAGCVVALTNTSANASISGRVLRNDGVGISKAVISISGGDLSSPISVRTNAFGHYSVQDLPSGQSYVVSVESKQYAFANPTRVVSLSGNLENEDFVAAP